MNMVKSLKGTQDLFPEDIKLWRLIESVSRDKFNLYGYREIRTPIIEESSLFIRSIGKDTDIVKKQMYSFKDQAGRDIALRPEETASVVRAYVEHHIDKAEGFVKYFYIGPMFRSERPQAGRLRQFHQIGVEAIGSYSPYIDAEMIILLDDLLKCYNIREYAIWLNSLGCEKDKAKLKDILKKELKYNLNALCADCKRRYKSNILRVLDCKNEPCRRVARSVKLADFLCKGCEDNFTCLKNTLEASGVRYKVSPFLVRGLDYYTGVVFEATTPHLGAQNAVVAGGRYDNLVSEFGGPKAGACGFAIGVERVIEAVSKDTPIKSETKKETVFIATMGDKAYSEGFKILSSLRREDIAADIDYQGRSLKAQMRYADRIKAKYAVILGEDELKKRAATVKDMSDSSQRQIPLNELGTFLKHNHPCSRNVPERLC